MNGIILFFIVVFLMGIGVLSQKKIIDKTTGQVSGTYLELVLSYMTSAKVIIATIGVVIIITSLTVSGAIKTDTVTYPSCSGKCGGEPDGVGGMCPDPCGGKRCLNGKCERCDYKCGGEDNGIGGVCDNPCKEGQVCKLGGICCTPECKPGKCGEPNGCGGICPDTCPEGEKCNGAGVCCKIDCSKTCGGAPDGCGGICPNKDGSVGFEYGCKLDEDGNAEGKECVPSCSGKCGGDWNGCGDPNDKENECPNPCGDLNCSNGKCYDPDNCNPDECRTNNCPVGVTCGIGQQCVNMLGTGVCKQDHCSSSCEITKYCKDKCPKPNERCHEIKANGTTICYNIYDSGCDACGNSIYGSGKDKYGKECPKPCGINSTCTVLEGNKFECKTTFNPKACIGKCPGEENNCPNPCSGSTRCIPNDEGKPAVCEPCESKCEGKKCGEDDGCGGACGCEFGQYCKDGECISCEGVCSGKCPGTRLSGVALACGVKCLEGKYSTISCGEGKVCENGECTDVPCVPNFTLEQCDEYSPCGGLKNSCGEECPNPCGNNKYCIVDESLPKKCYVEGEDCSKNGESYISRIKNGSCTKVEPLECNTNYYKYTYAGVEGCLRPGDQCPEDPERKLILDDGELKCTSELQGKSCSECTNEEFVGAEIKARNVAGGALCYYDANGDCKVSLCQATDVNGMPTYKVGADGNCEKIPDRAEVCGANDGFTGTQDNCIRKLSASDNPDFPAPTAGDLANYYFASQNCNEQNSEFTKNICPSSQDGIVPCCPNNSVSGEYKMNGSAYENIRAAMNDKLPCTETEQINELVNMVGGGVSSCQYYYNTAEDKYGCYYSNDTKRCYNSYADYVASNGGGSGSTINWSNPDFYMNVFYNGGPCPPGMETYDKEITDNRGKCMKYLECGGVATDPVENTLHQNISNDTTSGGNITYWQNLSCPV